MRPTRTQAKTSKCKQTPAKTSQDQSRQLKICQDKLSNIKHQQLSHPKGFQTGFIFMYDKPLTHTSSEPHIGVLRFCIWHSWSLLQRQPNINNTRKKAAAKPPLFSRPCGQLFGLIEVSPFNLLFTFGRHCPSLWSSRFHMSIYILLKWSVTNEERTNKRTKDLRTGRNHEPSQLLV